jgi:hypothetical protein
MPLYYVAQQPVIIASFRFTYFSVKMPIITFMPLQLPRQGRSALHLTLCACHCWKLPRHHAARNITVIMAGVFKLFHRIHVLVLHCHASPKRT